MPPIGAVLLMLSFALTASAETIRVGAAISLKDAITEIARNYEAATGEHVEFTLGSSGQIMAQINSGGDIDLFVSAAAKQVDELEKEKLVDSSSRRVIVANALVLIVPADARDAPISFESLAQSKVTRIAVGEPKTVAAGQYAQQVFKSLKLTDALANKLVYCTNVRQALSYVERGEVSCGVVYATDAKESGEKVRIVATAAATTHEPIIYPGVVVTASKKRGAAKRFLAYLTEAGAKAVFKSKGFGVVEDSATGPSER